MYKKLRIVVFFSFLIISSLHAQQGRVDATFNTFDDGTAGEGFDGNVRVIIENPDETTFIAGDFLNFNGVGATRIIKLDSSGDKDSGFTSGAGFDNSVVSGFKTFGADGALNNTDDKLIYGGSFSNYNGVSKKYLARLNLDGTLDASFNSGNVGPNNVVQALAQLSDGSIIVAGDAITRYNGTIVVNNVFKISADGVLDTAFNSNITAGTTGTISKVIIQQDKKILICGSFTSFNGITTRGLIRLNGNGTVDTSFNTNLGAGADNNILAIDLQTDGKIVLGGAFTSFNGVAVGRIIRLNSDGTIDGTFNNAKAGFANGIVQAIRFTTAGIYVAGSFTGTYNGVANGLNRLTLLKDNGDWDSGFDNVTGLPSTTFYAIEKAIDGQIYIGGSFTIYDATLRGRLAKVSNAGSLDINFMSAGGVGANGNVLKVIPLSSKKVMIFGSFTSFNGSPVNRIARLNEDGSLDKSFNSAAIVATAGASSTIRAAVQLADGSFIIGGDFTKYNNTTRNRILKIKADGTLDSSFVPVTIGNGGVYALSVDNVSGKILVGGSFTSVGGVPKNRLVRLNSDGSLDTAFTADVNGSVLAISPESTGGKIVIGGNFTIYNGTSVTYLVRIQSDGSLDSTYNNTTGPNGVVYEFGRQSGDKLLVGGSFTTFGGKSKGRFLRLDNNGAIDLAFYSGIAFNSGDVRTISVQPDDRIILGGQFNGTFSGTDAIAYPVSRIVRLNSDGSYNTSFKATLNNICYTSAIDSEGRIMIGGNFNSVSGVAKYRVARLLACINNTAYIANDWTRGVPNKSHEVSIDDNLTLNSDTNFCNCSVATGKKLTVDTGIKLTLELDVFGNTTTRNGIIEFNNAASLLQTDSHAVNTGTVIYKRNTDELKKYDYVYWGSPVVNQQVTTLAPNTDLYYSWTGSNWGAESGTMTPGKGYIIRVNSPLISQLATFTGKPNNGDISYTTPVGTYSLVSNPYPSAINADEFIKANFTVTSSSGGATLYFWTHNIARYQNGNQLVYSSNDYASYNLTGGVGTQSKKARDKENQNDVGESSTGQIGAGQAFFVARNLDGKFVFNNLMRSTGSMENKQFFRQSKTKKSTTNKKSRVWLNLTNAGGAFKQLLVGYITDATNEYDNLYDGVSYNGNSFVDFYSINEAKNLTIQGRKLPFNTADEVPLGYKTTIAGTFQIGIDDVDGDLIDQPIYLEDKLTNKTHNLKSGDYSFTTEIGTFKDRFVLRYTDTSKLGTGDFEIKEKEVIVSVKDRQIKINSFAETIASVKIYDLKGSLIYENDKVNKNEFIINHLKSSNQFLIVMAQLENGKWISEEIIFHD
ncbi:T9SS sorting signal type C domain-containing protein [Flavobacterium sp.]|uniref:T9SS sorting signal type C domain-containing protein n=1 Tax=Flavobacterium sp. TaxID=239 RepID=UPI002B57672D|nr:T9SS sorting signal type C domain-containing protein [Flavobacterium sp.]HSD08143.1 T9SS sorting signal type C domain-containing protein [Flavobacterium sp.]